MTTAIALALAGAWAAATTVVVSPARHQARRRIAGSVARPLAPVRALGPSPPRSGGTVGALGGWVRRATGLGPPDTSADRRIGWAAIAGVALMPMVAPLAPVPVLWALLAPVLRARAAERRREAAVVDQVPDLVDLLALTTAAGLPVGVALAAIGDRPGGPAGAAVARSQAYMERGGSTTGGLDHLAALGPAARPLVDALAQHDRYGTPLLPALQRVAIETRARRRRRAEEAARRLPVTLLLPLVLTTLPAFVLLTVVPLLAGSLTALSG
jgi:tight adherence protein C